jgi:glutathione S-transferase
MPSAPKPIVHHIPVCPFSQRLEILLALKQRSDAAEFRVVDITRPRDPELLKLSRGTTALPIMETANGVLKESLVLLRFLEDRFPDAPIAREDPYERAVENMLIAREGSFTTTGYLYVMNQDESKREEWRNKMLEEFRQIDEFLTWQNPDGVFLFDRFGLAETVLTPMLMRFWFLEYYEGFDLPENGFARVRRWRDACLEHPGAQQVTREEIVKLYYDYAKGAGNGALLPGRQRSSFVFEPHWRSRPWPPADKYRVSASDAELGLLQA